MSKIETEEDFKQLVLETDFFKLFYISQVRPQDSGGGRPRSGHVPE